MAIVTVETEIAAPIEICFDLARDIDFHVRSLEHTGERAVAGVTSGLIGFGESVTWEARHLGVTQRLTSSITAFEPPGYFQDTMSRGAFKRFRHDHFFEVDPNDHSRAVMRDVIDFASPFGPLGWLVDRVFMANYLRRLIAERGRVLRDEAQRIAIEKAGVKSSS